jgi:hypothetical protein
MAKVQGVKEKLHSPIYDAFFVKDESRDGTSPNKKTFTDFMTDPRVIRFFVDIQNKTKLETNLQASGVLPSLNTFEARALRVVVSNLRLTERKKITQKTSTIDIEAQISESEILADLIYNSVTSLIVGEKIMIEMPTFWFPSGAGVSPGFPTVSNHAIPLLPKVRVALRLHPVPAIPHLHPGLAVLHPRRAPGVPRRHPSPGPAGTGYRLAPGTKHQARRNPQPRPLVESGSPLSGLLRHRG